MFNLFRFLNNSLVFGLLNRKIKILKHNEINLVNYPEKSWYLVPYPFQKGYPFNFDNLSTVNRHSFISDDKFKNAIKLSEKRWSTNGDQIRNISWRLHVMFWSVDQALKNIDVKKEIFLECGTGKGYMAAGITEYFNWGIDKPVFYLIDSFKSTMPDENGVQKDTGEQLFVYADGDSEVRDYFSKYECIEILTGFVPDILNEVPHDKFIKFLHLDLNNFIAEKKALDLLISRFRTGTIILFDDFGGPGGEKQALIHEEFARINNKYLLQLPTGQAIIIW